MEAHQVLRRKAETGSAKKGVAFYHFAKYHCGYAK